MNGTMEGKENQTNRQQPEKWKIERKFLAGRCSLTFGNLNFLLLPLPISGFDRKVFIRLVARQCFHFSLQFVDAFIHTCRFCLQLLENCESVRVLTFLKTVVREKRLKYLLDKLQER